MALTDYPFLGDQPRHFRWEICRDPLTDELVLWDNDEAIIVPGCRVPYACKLVLIKMARKLEAGLIPITWAAYAQ